jgi:hypothetical protein
LIAAFALPADRRAAMYASTRSAGRCGLFGETLGSADSAIYLISLIFGIFYKCDIYFELSYVFSDPSLRYRERSTP